MTDLATRIEAQDASNEEILEGFGGVKEANFLPGIVAWTFKNIDLYTGPEATKPWSKDNMQDVLDLMAAVLPGSHAVISTIGRAVIGSRLFVSEYRGSCEGNPAAALAAATVRAVHTLEDMPVVTHTKEQST